MMTFSLSNCRRTSRWLGLAVMGLLSGARAYAGPTKTPPKGTAAPTTSASSAGSAATSASPTTRDAMKSTASDLFDKGVKAMDEGRWEDCRAALLAAWSVHPSYQIAGNLAECEVKLGRAATAAEHLRFFLREMPATAPPERKARGEELLREVRPKIAELTVRVNKVDAEVLVDGVSVGRSPLAASIFLEPGEHPIEAKLAEEHAKQTVSTKGGEVNEVVLHLGSAGERTVEPRSMVPAYVIGGVGVASLIAGGVLVGLYKAGEADVREHMPRDAQGQPLCQRPPAAGTPLAECADLATKTREANAYGTGAPILFAVGGVAAAGVIAYLLWPASKPVAAQSSMRVVPSFGANGVGVSWTGSF